ncbi:sulfate adenylyltransferase subunit CysN [Pelagibaculum spongiae]|uniref:Sulfate adenylyltransferase subunit 1 n=1 Tax=Pelagibaculum spongiae TaxID=2080658 RepID=A0A2V1GV04_9GAMM|nr:sulfate adenylyltransferase subunit CysN [Pelagibaculum spongiae]PVZ70235.1 sulfate adenylyltransferase subunit CysN [Pelagibaculum spongiae]
MAHASDLIKDDIFGYLQQHEEKDILRFLTCGNVDDGKSTLIGRLLHDSKLIFEDQLAAIKQDSQKFNTTNQEFDLALLVDGLQSEREQGITIDVAYRYFSTDKRKFIIADCPGHEQYTRNMATGASTCDLAIILIDARKGIQTQTKRHSYIVNLLGIKNVIVAVNKMDLMDYDETVFENIKSEYLELSNGLGISNVSFIPMSALLGDNVVDKSKQMPWYQEETFIQKLETIEIHCNDRSSDFRLPVQYVNRPNLDFRGFCGTIAAGEIAVGDMIETLPSGKQSKVKSIVSASGEVASAIVGEAVTLTLADEIDISRGDMIVKGVLPTTSNAFTANLIWMDDQPLELNKEYLFKLGTKSSFGTIKSIKHRIDVNTMNCILAESLQLNEVAVVEVYINDSVVFDAYKESRNTGNFVVIDRIFNSTVAAGMIIESLDSSLVSNVAEMSYQERVVEFNKEVELLVHKYFKSY